MTSARTLLKTHALLIGITFMTALGCATRTPVYHVSESSTTKSDKTRIVRHPGLFYALPKTVIRGNIPATKTTYSANDLAEYAPLVGIELPGILQKVVIKRLFPEATRVSIPKKTGTQPSDAEYMYRYLAAVVDPNHALGATQADLVKAIAKDGGHLGGLKLLSDSDWNESRATSAITALFDTLAKFNGPQPKNIEKLAAASLKFSEPTIEAIGVGDVDALYFIELGQLSIAQQHDIIFQFSAMGLMTSADISVADKTADYVVATISAAAKTVGGLVPSGAGASFVGQPNKAVSNEWGKAWSIADQIRDLRAKRADTVMGKGKSVLDINVEVLDRMLAELDKLEKQLLANFYTSKESTGAIRFTKIPESGMPSKSLPIDLCQFSPDAGLSSPKADVLFSKGLNIDAKIPSTKGLKPIKLVLTTSPKSQVAQRINTLRADYLSDHDPKGKLGLRYRIPVQAKLEIMADKEVLLTQYIPIAQWGVIEALPAGANAAEVRMVTELYEQTGALKKLEFHSQPLDPNLIDKLGDAGAAIAKYEAARRAAAAAQPSQLEKTVATLEQIQKLQSTLGGIVTFDPTSTTGGTEE